MKKEISIAIVTKNRPKKLQRCLESIQKQTKLPSVVIIVDNDIKRRAEKVALSFKENLNLSYVVEPKPGVARARNKALEVCKTPLLGFVDDDCVLDKNWVKTGLNLITATKKATYVLGKSLLYNTKNIVALAQYYHQSYWFNQKLKENKLKTSPFNLDTKNIILKTPDLRKKDLKFSPQFSIKGADSSDTDLGFQLEAKSLTGIYEARMIVFHEELENPVHFLKKAYLRGRLAFLLVSKWNLQGEFVDLKLIRWTKFAKSIRFWKKELRSYTGKHSESTLLKIPAFILIKTYERVYLKGYINQACKLGVNLEE